MQIKKKLSSSPSILLSTELEGKHKLVDFLLAKGRIRSWNFVAWHFPLDPDSSPRKIMSHYRSHGGTTKTMRYSQSVSILIKLLLIFIIFLGTSWDRPPKKWPYCKKSFFLFKWSSYQHVASGCVCVSGQFLIQLCGVCKGDWRVWRFALMYCSERYVYRKIALLNSLNFTTSKEPNSHSFQATGLTLISKEAEFCAVESNKEFFQFSNFKTNSHSLRF